MKTISIPSRRWYENQEREIQFPDRWEVDYLTSPGFDKPGMTLDLIKEKLNQPLQGPTLEEMARGKKEAVILFDDMTRPTPIGAVALHVLESLHRAGMKNDQIRFIWSLGGHGTYDMINARKKLGAEIVENYAIYNHDPFQNCVRVGRTPTGVELWINREVMACDLKIGIGGVSAHVHVGYGGGAKIILPGVAGIESINQFHNQLHREPGRTGLANFENNIMRAECDAAGQMVDLNFKVECLINRRGDITDIFAGPFREAQAAGAEEGKEHYGIPYSTGYDIAVCNAYGKANESAIAAGFAPMTLKPGGTGTAVLVFDSPEGQVPHYVFRSWGKDYGGRQFMPKVDSALDLLDIKKLILFSPYPDRMGLDLLCPMDDAVIAKTWPEVLAILEMDYPKEAKVAVVQDGTMQYMKPGP